MDKGAKPGFWLGWFIPTFFAAVALAVFLVTRTYLIPDTDALYHVGHALAYQENGIFSSAFPWATASAIGEVGGDLWYGFHLLLLPVVSLVNDPAATLPLVQGFVIFLGYFALAIFFREAETPYAYLMPMLVFAGHEYGPWRALMTRPGTISLGLFLLVIIAILRGRPWLAGVAAFLFAFIHLTVSWLVLLSIFVVILLQVLLQLKIEHRAIFATLGALAIGVFLRPNPIGTLTLLKIQLLDVAQLLHHRPPLRFGIEVTQPLHPETFLQIALPMLLLMVAGVVTGIAFWKQAEFQKQRPIWAICAIFSVAFFMLTLLQSSRTVELWSTACVGMLATLWQTLRNRWPTQAGWAVLAPMALIVWNLYAGVNTLNHFGRDPQALRPAADWLRKNAEPDAIVFHPLWEDFPGLFAFNRQQRYLGGMDPVFQYQFNQEKYWIAHWMCEDRPTHDVATTQRGFGGHTEPMATALRKRFGATYLAIPVPRLGSLSQHLSGQSDFELKGIFGQTAIYRIRPDTTSN
ncbi:MAG: hypothetical protein KF812_08420 [Fimbriimonadaceae bacterium]|nr:hypothetical protein [Fimbriimonadaceae bacterium]